MSKKLRAFKDTVNTLKRIEIDYLENSKPTDEIARRYCRAIDIDKMQEFVSYVESLERETGRSKEAK